MVQHFQMTSAIFDVVPLWISSHAIIERNGTTFTRLCSASGILTSDVNLSFAQQMLVSLASSIGVSLSLAENVLHKYVAEHVHTADGNHYVVLNSPQTSDFSDKVFLTQAFYFPDNCGTELSILLPDGSVNVLTGPLFPRWPINDNDGLTIFVETEGLHEHLAVGKTITSLDGNFESARSSPSDKSHHNHYNSGGH